MTLPALPDPRALALLGDLERIESEAVERLPSVSDLDMLEQWRAQAEALEAYVQRRNLDPGPLLGIERRTEARIGQLVTFHGLAYRGKQTHRINDKLIAEFHLLAKALDGNGISLKTWRRPRAELIREIKAQLEPKPDREAASQPTFNTVNDNIGWARWSWNPVTGCLHSCDYCYARDLAERFYPQKFAPTFLPERLAAPANTRLPRTADDDPAWRRVFTCSMADLFGKWVPKDWIAAVFDAIDQHRQWEYLCLTKFPQRLAQLDWPDNVWAGTTVDRQHRVAVAERAFSKVTAGVKWLSCEPLLEPLQFKSLGMFDWVVIGASTGSAHAQPFAPPFEWVVDLYEQARAAGCRVYLKHNLFGSSDGRGPGMEPVREWPR